MTFTCNQKSNQKLRIIALVSLLLLVPFIIASATITSNADTPQCTYLVHPGDYLWLVQQETGVPWQQIASLNGIQSPYAIHPGQVLVLEPNCGSTSSSSSSSGNELRYGSEMTNHLFSQTCQSYQTAAIIDRYNTNFTVKDAQGVRAWRVGFVASDNLHGYYVEAFFSDEAIPGTFEGASAAIHQAEMSLWTNNALIENVSIVANNADGHSQLPGGLVPNRTIIAGDFVDFFVANGYLQVFWYQTNNTIHNQQQIFSTNIQIPSNFEITDEYQIFTPLRGAGNSLNFSNFNVAIQESQIANVVTHVPLTFSESAPRCASTHPTLQLYSNICFDNPFLTVDSAGRPNGIYETMLSSDIDTLS